MIQTLEVDVKENKDGSATLLLEMDANTKGLFVQAALKGLVWEINESMEVQEPSDPEGSELVELPTKAVNSLITYAIQNALAKGLSGYALLTASGISKGECGQFRASRVAAISSSPSGAPCIAAVPALFGDPKPIVVLQATSDGLS